jgi:hypothetical protein
LQGQGDEQVRQFAAFPERYFYGIICLAKCVKRATDDDESPILGLLPRAKYRRLCIFRVWLFYFLPAQAV